ncbi:MAG TPA: aldose 1-epimerase family protein [Acidimicrobiales bacterium]|nr:aldose 1-epimerase family protein [Acidimicrobiales bacterium]
MATPPSGHQHRIVSGDQAATVVEVGGGLRKYTVAGEPVLDGYQREQMADGGRGQHLIPWPNRVRDGQYRFQGEDLQLALTEPGRHNASHGLVRWSNWSAAVEEADRLVMQLDLHPQPGYPFTLGLSVEYRLGPDGLSVATTATNHGDRPCPYGIGAHPYLTAGTDLVDAALLQVPAETRLEADDRGIPTGSAAVDGTPYDFRTGRAIDDLVLDTAFTDLTGNEAVLAAPEGRRVTVWWDSAYRWLMVFTGDTLDPVRRRKSLALEPMTCAPNAFVTGDGLRVLQPEESWTTTWGIAAGPRR